MLKSCRLRCFHSPKEYSHFAWLGEIRVIIDNVRVLVLMPLIHRCSACLVLQYLAEREREHTRVHVTSQTCSNCIFSVLSLNSFKFFKVNDNDDENALLGWPCWSCGIALLESDLCRLRDNFSFTWNWVKITFLSTGMPAHSFCGLTSNCVTQSKEG